MLRIGIHDMTIMIFWMERSEMKEAEYEYEAFKQTN